MKLKPILLVTLILTAAVAVSGVAFGETLRVSIRKAPIRTGPGSTSELVAMAMEGTLLELVDKDGLWYIVRVPDTGAVGYVHSALVEMVADSTPVASPAAPREPVAAPPPPPVRTAEPARQPQPPPPPRTSTRSNPPADPPARQTSYTSRSTGDSAPYDSRGFGIGLRTGFSTLGTTAFNVRTWGYRAGLSLDVSYLSVGDFADLQLFPSVLFKVGGPFVLDAVYFQPYAGAGANILWHRNQEIFLDEKFTLSAGGLGGVEVGFMHVPNLTVSTDIGYFSKSFYGYETVSDIGLTIGVDWYFK